MRFNSLQLGLSYDDAHYIILANLASGQGYQLINFRVHKWNVPFRLAGSITCPLTFLFRAIIQF